MSVILETERLILRTWEKADVEPMTAIDQDPQVCEFLPGIGTLEATQEHIFHMKNHYAEHGFSKYAVELKSTHEMIGFVGLSVPSFDAHFTPCVEIGWRLASSHWNQGYATEAAKAVLNYAFMTLDLDEVVAFTVPANLPSRRVMEKIGLRYSPHDDFEHPKLDKTHPLCKHLLYRLSKADYFESVGTNHSENNLPQTLHYRKARTSDLPAIIALLSEDELGKTREQVGLAPDPRYLEAFNRIEKDENAYLMVVLLGEEIIGTCHLNLLPSLTFLGSTRFQIEAVRVSTSHQRKGIGEWMIKQAIVYGKAQGASIFQLTTNKQRIRAKSFYERLGFQATHEGMKLYTQKSDF